MEIPGASCGVSALRRSADRHHCPELLQSGDSAAGDRRDRAVSAEKKDFRFFACDRRDPCRRFRSERAGDRDPLRRFFFVGPDKRNCAKKGKAFFESLHIRAERADLAVDGGGGPCERGGVSDLSAEHHRARELLRRAAGAVFRQRVHDHSAREFHAAAEAQLDGLRFRRLQPCGDGGPSHCRGRFRENKAKRINENAAVFPCADRFYLLLSDADRPAADHLHYRGPGHLLSPRYSQNEKEQSQRI